VVLSEGDDILERWLGEEVEEVGEKKKKKNYFIDIVYGANSEFK
jgi:preprotein translocase subunit SecA